MAFTSDRATSNIDRDSSPSPYPPSTPSLDSDSEDEMPSLVASGLRATLTTLPEHHLRDIVLRLASSDSSFRRALQREVSRVEEPETPPVTPTRASHRKPAKKSRKTRKSRGGERRGPVVRPPSVLSELPTPEESQQDQLVYHPGHLEDEVYEFVSRTSDGAAFKVVQTVTMWSCCNEDEWSSGCILITPEFDQDIEGLVPLDTKSLSRSDIDVYPDDSDLESPYSSDLLTPVSPVRGQSVA